VSRLKFSDRSKPNATASKALRSFGIFLLLIGCASDPGTIGAAMGKTGDGRLFVRSMPPDQGAAQAGLRIDDEIVALDGKDVKAMSDDDVRRAVRGEAGSNLVVTIVRDGQRQDVTVKRSKLLKDKK